METHWHTNGITMVYQPWLIFTVEIHFDVLFSGEITFETGILVEFEWDSSDTSFSCGI